MIKSVRKNLPRFLALLISFLFLCSLLACSNADDETAESNVSVQITSFAGSPTSLTAGHSSILTVKITDDSGAALSGRTVNFAFVTNNSGGTVEALNGGITDAGGKAVAVYTAGSTTTSTVLEDTLQATCKNASEALIITRIATSISGYRLSLSADVTSLKAGESSIVTATVTDSSGSAVAGQAVTFTKLIDNSTMGLITLGTGTTDAAGKAIAVYTAGTNNADQDVQDTVEAEISGGASYGAVIITRSGEENAAADGYQITVTADNTSLKAGESAIITANVTNSSGNPVQGQTVTFTEFIDNSGATLQTLNSGRTDAGGKAVAIYTAGSGSTGSVQDTIQAGVDDGTYSATGAVIITRLAESATATGVNMSISAAPTTLKAGNSSIITATVTDAEGNPLEGETVTFTTLIDQSGIVSLTTLGTTDASGKVVAVYTAGDNDATDDVQDTIQASVSSGGYNAYGAVIINRTGTTSSTTVPSGYKLTLEAGITSLAAGGHSVLTATVTDGANNPVGNLSVTFAVSTNNSGSTLSATSATTDAAGRAVVYYTAGNTSPGSNVQDAVTATVSGGGYSSTAAEIITRTAAATTGYVITLTPTPSSLGIGAMSVLVAKVYNADGTVASGQSVTFAIEVNNSGADPLIMVNTTTDAHGEAKAIYTAGASESSLKVEDVVSATLAGGEADAAIITRLPESGTGNRLSLYIGASSAGGESSYVLPATNGTCIVTAKVVSDTDPEVPVAGVEVTFSIETGSGTITTINGTTDNNGLATAYYTGPGGQVPGNTVVRAQIFGTTNGGDAAGIIYYGVPTLTLAADYTSRAAGEQSALTATLRDVDGTPISGIEITFTLTSNPSGGSVTVLSATTNVNGQAFATYTAGSADPTANVLDYIEAVAQAEIKVQETGENYFPADSIAITRTGTP